MEQKTKFIVIGLAGAVVLSLVFLFQSINTAQKATRERDDLAKENSAMSAKLDRLQESAREYEGKLSSLKNELDQASSDKSELQRKFDLISKERDSLADKIKELKSKPESPAEVAMPATPDEYWAQVLKAKTGLEMQLGSIRSELKSIQISNEQLQRDKSTIEIDVKSLSRERDDLQRQLGYNKKLMDSLAQEVVREKNDKMLIEESVKSIKGENQSLARQLKSLSTRKVSLERRVQELSDSKDTLEKRISEMELMLNDKLSQANQLKENIEAISGENKNTLPAAGKSSSVELPPIVVRPQPETAIAKEEGAPAVGKIVAINRENNFVVVDMGAKSGLKVGSKLNVYRDDKNIAALEVIQARADISACDIKKESPPVKIGDVVK